MFGYCRYVCPIVLSIAFQFIIFPSQAQTLRKVKFVTSDGTLLSAYIMRPRGRGKFPAIVALHGCSGLKRDRYTFSSRHTDWAERFVRWGYVVVFPDSHGSRKIPNLCKKRIRPIGQRERIKDALAARAWLYRQPYVNKDNISILGWSNGGATALRIAYSKEGVGFKQAFAFYPRCRFILKEKNKKQSIPLTIFMGKRDDWNSPKACQRLVWDKGGHIILYDRAYHGFDMPNEKLRTIMWLAFTKHDLGVAHLGTNHRARRQVISDIRRLLSLRERTRH